MDEWKPWPQVQGMSKTNHLVVALTLAACEPTPTVTIVRVDNAPAANPLADLQTGDSGDLRFGGRVEESLCAGPYTYLAVRDDVGALRWVATMGAGPPIGAAVEVNGVGLRTRFRSARLGRSFDALVFGPVTALDPQQPEHPQG